MLYFYKSIKSIMIIKELENIKKLPLEIWRYIINDLVELPLFLWKKSMNETHRKIHKHLHRYIWQSSYNMITKLYYVKLFRREDEKYIYVNSDAKIKEETSEKYTIISNKKMEKIYSNKEMEQYIMTDVTNNRIVFNNI